MFVSDAERWAEWPPDSIAPASKPRNEVTEEAPLPRLPLSFSQARTGEMSRTRSASILALPALIAAGIGALALTPRVQSSDVLVGSFLIAAASLLAWTAVVAAWPSLRRGIALEARVLPQHWIQACCQVAVLAYWGWHWRAVYDMAVLFAAQIAFAYAFGMLLSWSRGRPYGFGFGPVPIIFSINLFLWFKDDWFYLQFLMIGVGFLGKEFIRWHRDGRRVHIFNPSAFALGIFSLVLIATGTTDLTWGREIASTLTLAPRIYLFLFLVGLVVMHFFSITLIAGTAALLLFGLSAAYAGWAGVPYFIDSEIPAAVFLGLHLLVTDPSTSPRTPLGKVMFGALYGIGVFALYAVLGAAGVPTFYDKLLCVPLLNLSVRGIDHAVRVLAARRGPTAEGTILDPARVVAGGAIIPETRFNLAHMGVWVAFFALMSTTGRTDGFHRGDSLPFWEAACAEGRRGACDRLVSIEQTYCRDNSAWACNELGIHYAEGLVEAPSPELGERYFARACELRYQPACLNFLSPGTLVRSDPRPLDLRLLLREGGLNLMEMSEPELIRRACGHDWRFACTLMASAD
jgi:hypothetical protein